MIDHHGGGDEHKEAVKMYKEKAAEHAAAAGDKWDEGSHPRDENGKFA